MLLILAALQHEVAPILSEIDILEKISLRPSVIYLGQYKKHDVIVARTGVGSRKMQRAAKFCIEEYKPQTSINIGYCGGLVPNLGVGDIVVANSVIDEATQKTYTPKDISHLMTGGEDGLVDITIHTGAIVTVNKPIETPHSKAFLGTKYGAIAVDMESAGLAKVAEETNTDFAIVHAVMDSMDMHLSEAQTYAAENGTTDMVKIVSTMIKKPAKILSIPKFEQSANKARASLIKFVDRCVFNS